MRIGDFVSKEDFFRYIKDNKSKIISEKKSAIKYADAIDFINVKTIEKSEFAIKEDYFEQVTRKNYTFDKKFYMKDVLYFRCNND